MWPFLFPDWLPVHFSHFLLRGICHLLTEEICLPFSSLKTLGNPISSHGEHKPHHCRLDLKTLGDPISDHGEHKPHRCHLDLLLFTLCIPESFLKDPPSILFSATGSPSSDDTFLIAYSFGGEGPGLPRFIGTTEKKFKKVFFQKNFEE